MTWLRYVIHTDVAKYEAAGWSVVCKMIGHHGHYSHLMQWEGNDEPR